MTDGGLRPRFVLPARKLHPAGDLAPDALPLVETLGIGYHAVELATSTLMATAVRFHQEDPWARIDAMHRAAPDTTLGFLTTGKRFISFSAVTGSCTSARQIATASGPRSTASSAGRSNRAGSILRLLSVLTRPA